MRGGARGEGAGSVARPGASRGARTRGVGASVLPDVLAPGLAVVFCGTAAGAVSARRGAYYAGPGNAFWPVLYRIGLTPRLLAPPDYPSLPEFGLGLTDLAKAVSGADHTLAAGDFDRRGLHARILAHAPAILAFTGKRAARAFLGRTVDYGVQPETVGATRLFVLPSPSGAARRFWDERPWHALATLRARLRGGASETAGGSALPRSA